MFEDFSFSSPSSARLTRLTLDGDDRLMLDSDSTLVSPLSSRCPSPNSSRCLSRTRSARRTLFRCSTTASQQPPTSVPFPYYEDKHFSIGTLTQKLHEHSLRASAGDGEAASHDESRDPSVSVSVSANSLSPVAPFPVSVYALPTSWPEHTTPKHDDEPCADSFSTAPSPAPPSLPDTASCSSPSSFSSWFCPTTASSSVMVPASPTEQPSKPSGCDVMDARAPSDLAFAQRERAAFLASADDGLADRFAAAEVDWHPSSLPPEVSPRRRALTLSSRGRLFGRAGAESPRSGGIQVQAQAGGRFGAERERRRSVSGGVMGPSSCLCRRVDKTYYQVLTAGGRLVHRRSAQALRRRSVVGAALAALAERELGVEPRGY